MTDAFKFDKDGKTAAFDMTRLPATCEVILPSDVKRRALIAAVSGVFTLMLAAALYLLAKDLGKAPDIRKWKEIALSVVVFLPAAIGTIALLRAYNEVAGWDRRRQVTIGDGYVEIRRWPIIGSAKFNHVRLTDYIGVMKICEPDAGPEERYSVGLIHDDANLDVLFYSSDSAAGWDEKWQDYADRLHLPAIDQGHRPKDAQVDGTPAIKVLPGGIFTLDVDDVPTAALFDAPPWNRLRGLLFGLGMIGLLGALLLANWPLTWGLPGDMNQAVWMLLVSLAGAWSLSTAVKSHLAYRTVLIDRTHVTATRRRLSGVERWVEPLSAFQGVRGSARKETVYSHGRTEKAMRYAITLVHPDRQKLVILYRAAYEDDLMGKLQYYAERLGVPILEEVPG